MPVAGVVAVEADEFAAAVVVLVAVVFVAVVLVAVGHRYLMDKLYSAAAAAAAEVDVAAVDGLHAAVSDLNVA